MSAKEEYNRFDYFYDILCSYTDKLQLEKNFIEKHQKILKELGNNARILDASCGNGINAVALKKRGFDIVATDISEKMIELTRKYAKERRVDIDTRVMDWIDLPNHFQNQFDMLICVGNSISHSQNRNMRVTYLRSFRQSLKEGGILIVDTRNWEKLIRESWEYQVLPKAYYENRVFSIVYSWQLNRMEENSSVDILFIEHKDSENKLERIRLTFTPFGYQDFLLDCQAAGFEILYDSYGDDCDYYTIYLKY